MKTMIAFLIFLLVPWAAFAHILIEAPNGERRLRYELCDEHHNCRMVDAFESGKARVLEEEEWGRDTLVFTVPTWM
jgi:hypothetical protein